MAELNKLGLELEGAIEVAMTQSPQDITETIRIFGEMNTLRQEGHAEFKDDH